MEDQQNSPSGRFEAAATTLAADPSVTNASHSSLLQYVGYDDGNTALAESRVRMLRAAARLRRLFLLPVPDAPGLTFLGGEADPAVLGNQHEGSPIGNLAGSGLTSQRAFEACVGEGIEYLSQFTQPDDTIESGPLTAFGEGRDEDARRFVIEILAASSIAADHPIAWAAASRVSDGAKAWFPLDLCYRRRAIERDFAPPLKLSSGCAAGVTVEAATLRALLELVERDAVALWWRGGRLGRSISPDSEAAGATAQLLAQLRHGRTERKTWLLDITTDVGIPVIVALSTGADGVGFAFGFGARLNLAEAACAAIFELCQVELGQHVIAAKRRESGDGALNESDRKQSRRGASFDTHGCRLLQPKTGQEDSANRDQVAASGLGLAQALERLEARGIALYTMDLTRPEFGVPVVRVLAPALQLEPCQIVGPRLAATISETGGGAVHHGGMEIL
jgi:ribosomal protein S12 methylthiotransferase accessory factor